MRAGEVSKRVSIYRKEQERGDFSSKGVSRFVHLITTKARRQYSSGGINVDALEAFASVAVTFSFYPFARPFLRAGHIIEDEGEKFKILSVENNTRYRCIICGCERLNE